MIVVRSEDKRIRIGSAVCFLLFVIAFVIPVSIAQAQEQADAVAFFQRAQLEKVTLSTAAQSRIAASIAGKRAAKESVPTALQKSPAELVVMNAIRSNVQAFAADVTYGNTYFDTQSGDAFSFPEDAHDYCRAYFASDQANADYYLDASLIPGESLIATLTWDTPADYDLYIFDTEGYPVGDADPLADFDGANGTDAQSDASPVTDLIETASIAHTRAGADSDNFVVVIDRFRGSAANALSLTISGNDDVFVVSEYVLDDGFLHIDAVADAVVGSLTSGAVLDLDGVGSPRPNFNVAFDTDDCAESIVFTLVDADTGEIIETFTDNDAPYALFGDDNGDFNAGDLADGNYILTAIPYSGDNGEGAAADEQSVDFTVQSSATPPTVQSFALIDAATDTPIEGFNPINDGDVVDLVALFNQGVDINRLNLQAIVSDPFGQIEQVDLNLDITLLSGDMDNVTASDAGVPYSVYGDDNAGDFSDAALPRGAYVLSGTPQVGGMLLDASSVAFTVIGPRIGSYTLINASTDLPVDGSGGLPDFDPIPEGAVIDLGAIGINTINIRANPVDYNPPVIESVLLNMQSTTSTIQNRVEGFRPYAVFGDPSNMDLEDGDPNLDYNVWGALQNGSFVLFGQPFGENGGMGELYGAQTLNFSIINAGPPPADGSTDDIDLLPNYPNPFNPTTSIRFNIPESMHVRLEVFDMLGRSVMLLVDQALQGGYHEVAFVAEDLSSGMYLYRLETPTTVKIRPMTLLK